MVTIRPEQPGDEAAIAAVTSAAFASARHASGTEAAVVDELRKRGELAVSMVAENAGKVVGHLAASPVDVFNEAGESVASDWYGLGPFSVLPSDQRQGIGVMLMNAVLHELREREAAGAVLLGDPLYYLRFGFKPSESILYPGPGAEYFQALSFTGEYPQGTVKYSPAFFV